MFKVTICDLKNKDRNMADNIEHQYKGGEQWIFILKKLHFSCNIQRGCAFYNKNH